MTERVHHELALRDAVRIKAENDRLREYIAGLRAHIARLREGIEDSLAVTTGFYANAEDDAAKLNRIERMLTAALSSDEAQAK